VNAICAPYRVGDVLELSAADARALVAELWRYPIVAVSTFEPSAQSDAEPPTQTHPQRRQPRTLPVPALHTWVGAVLELRRCSN
jgi:hypothetical protein